MRKSVLVLLCCGAMLGLCVSSALAAGTPSQNAYSGTGNNQISQAQSTKTLPFTGLNVGVLGIVAAGLVGAGVVLRARTRTNS